MVRDLLVSKYRLQFDKAYELAFIKHADVKSLTDDELCALLELQSLFMQNPHVVDFAMQSAIEASRSYQITASEVINRYLNCDNANHLASEIDFLPRNVREILVPHLLETSPSRWIDEHTFLRAYYESYCASCNANYWQTSKLPSLGRSTVESILARWKSQISTDGHWQHLSDLEAIDRCAIALQSLAFEHEMMLGSEADKIALKNLPDNFAFALQTPRYIAALSAASPYRFVDSADEILRRIAALQPIGLAQQLRQCYATLYVIIDKLADEDIDDDISSEVSILAPKTSM